MRCWRWLGLILVLQLLAGCIGATANKTNAKSSSATSHESDADHQASKENHPEDAGNVSSPDPITVLCNPRTDLTTVACTADSSPVEMYTVRKGSASNNCTKVRVYQECLDNECGQKFLSKTWKNASTKNEIGRAHV